MTRLCAYPSCGKPFDAKRVDARFCSDTCRAKASKDRQRAGERPSSPSVPANRVSTAAPATASAPTVRQPPPPGATADGPTPSPSTIPLRPNYPPTGDYQPGKTDNLPVTVEGRLARLEDRLRDLEQDFENEEKRRYELKKAGGATTSGGGVAADQVLNTVRSEFGTLSAPWRKWGESVEAVHSRVRADVERLAQMVDRAERAGGVARMEGISEELQGLKGRVEIIEAEMHGFASQVSALADALGGEED